MILGAVILVLALLVFWLCYKLDQAWEPASGGLIIKANGLFLRADTIGEMTHVVDCYLRIRDENDESSSLAEAVREASAEVDADRLVAGYCAGYRQAEADNDRDDGSIPQSFINIKAREWIMSGQPEPSAQKPPAAPAPVVVDWGAVTDAGPCTRAVKHDGPCNGYPRVDCRGFDGASVKR